jgi:hypothetical protein
VKSSTLQVLHSSLEAGAVACQLPDLAVHLIAAKSDGDRQTVCVFAHNRNASRLTHMQDDKSFETVNNYRALWGRESDLFD